MELNHDWLSLQDWFYPGNKGGCLDQQSAADETAVFVVSDHDRVMEALSPDEDLSHWIGSSISQIAEHARGRKLVLVDRKEVETWWGEALTERSFFKQIEMIQAKAQVTNAQAFERTRDHFLLEGLRSGWNKILPSSYGFLIEVSAQKRFFLLVRRGELVMFERPVFEGSITTLEATKELSLEHRVPVQALVMGEDVWKRLHLSPKPWRQLMTCIRAKEAELVPFRWRVASLLALRGTFDLSARNL